MYGGTLPHPPLADIVFPKGELKIWSAASTPFADQICKEVFDGFTKINALYLFATSRGAKKEKYQGNVIATDNEGADCLYGEDIEGWHPTHFSFLPFYNNIL